LRFGYSLAQSKKTAVSVCSLLYCDILYNLFKIIIHDISKTHKLLKEALVLSIQEKSELIDQLIKSLDKPDNEIDELWKKEAENRIDAYDEGELSSVSVQEVFTKYKIDPR